MQRELRGKIPRDGNPGPEKNARSVKDIFIFINIHLKAEKAGGPEGGRAHQQRKKNKKPQAENHGQYSAIQMNLMPKNHEAVQPKNADRAKLSG